MSDGRLNFKATIDDADFNRKLNNMEKGVDGLNFNAPTKSLDGLNKKLLETKQRLQESKNELQRLNDQISNTAPGAVKNNLLGERNALNRSINEDKAAVIGYKQEITNLNRELGNTAKGSNTLKDTLSSLTRYFGALLGIGTVINLLRSFYDTTKQLQVLNKSMELGAKDSQSYASNISFLKDITEQYGLELISTSQAYNKFYTASKNKLGLGEIQLIFEKVSKASSLMGMSVADQSGVFKALEQMMSKGKVQAEELRMQLGDRLPGAFEIMAKAAGVSTAELDKLMKDGKVIASDVLPKFAIELEKAFGADKVNMIDNIAASENRLKNEWTDLVENINNGNGIITKAIMLFYDFSGGILSLINPSKTLTETLSDEQIGLNSLIGRITDVNIKNSERLILIEELKAKYPAYVRNIGEENLSNQELRNSLASVNDEYSKRILLQKEIDNLNSAVAQKDSWESAVLQNQIDLYEELIAINTKYNLGLEITPTNAYEMADKVQLAARKNISAYQQLKIEALQTDYNTFSKNADLASKNVDNVRKAYEELLRVLGVKTPTQIAQEESIYAYNRKLDEALTKAKGLGGKVGKDFNEFDLTGVNNYIKKIDELSTKQTSSNKKAESLAKKRMDFIFSLQKAENDLTQSTLSGLDLEKAKIEEVYQDRLKKAKELGANQEALNKIESLRDRETETVTYKADTEALKTSLEQQKKDYEDFENYKKQVGVEKAKEMYAGIIDVSKSYYDVLRDELASFGDRDDLTSVEKQRINELFKLLQDYNISKAENDRKSLEELIVSTQSAQERILAIQDGFAQKRKDLEKITNEQIRNEKLSILNQQEKDATAVIEDEIYQRGLKERQLIKELTSYTKKELENRIKSTEEFLLIAGENLSESQRKTLEGELDLLNSLNGSTDLIIRQNALLKEKERITKAIKNNTSKDPEIAKKLNNELEDVNGLIEGNKKDTISTAEGIQMAVQGANMLASAFGGVNKELQMAVEAIGNIVSALASGDMAGAVMAVAGTIIQGAIDVFGKNDTSAINSERLRLQEEYNKMLRDQLLIEARINDAYQSRVEAIREEMEVLSGNQKSVISRMKEILNTFYELYKDFGGFGSTNDFDFFVEWQDSGLNEYFENGVELSDELLNKLIELNSKAPLQGQMKDLFDELIRLKEEFGSVDEAVKQLEKELQDRLTGTTAQSLADSIREGIASGKRSFSDFADDIEGFLRNAILAGMSASIIEPQIQQLQDMLYEMMKDGVLTEEERRNFEEEYARIAEEASQYLDLINQAGVNIGGLDDFGAGAKDGIKRITESQADRLTGILTGMQVDVIESRKSLQLSNNLLSSSLDNLIAIEINTRATADNTYQLVQILQNNQQQSLGL